MTNKTYLIIKKILLEYIKYLYATDVVILSKTFIHSFIHIIYFGKKHISNATGCFAKILLSVIVQFLHQQDEKTPLQPIYQQGVRQNYLISCT